MFNNLMYGLQVAGVGIVIVFAVLVILILVITLFSKFFGLVGNKGKKSEAAPVSQKAPETAAVAEVAQPEYELVDDLELIAVISAAVAACDDSGKLVVRSVRRVTGWNRAARAEQVVRF